MMLDVLHLLGVGYQSYRALVDSGPWDAGVFVSTVDVFGIQAYIERALMKIGVL